MSTNFVAHPNSSVLGSWPTFLCKTQGTHTASTANSVKGGFRCTIASFNWLALSPFPALTHLICFLLEKRQIVFKLQSFPTNTKQKDNCLLLLESFVKPVVNDDYFSFPIFAFPNENFNRKENRNQYALSPYWSLYISWGADGENLSNNHELLRLMMISFFLITLKFHSGVIL